MVACEGVFDASGWPGVTQMDMQGNRRDADRKEAVQRLEGTPVPAPTTSWASLLGCARSGAAMASIPSTVMKPATNDALAQRVRRSRSSEAISCWG